MIGRSSHIGNGLDFNGVDQYVEVPADPLLDFQPGDAFSIEVWFYYDGSSDEGGTPVSLFTTIHGGVVNPGGYQMRLSTFLGDTTLRAEMFNIGNTKIMQSLCDIPLTSLGLYHLVWAQGAGVSTSDTKLYTNAEEAAIVFNTTLTTSDSIPFRSPRIATGKVGTGTVYTSQRQYITRVYDKQLSASEVSDLYNQKTPKELGLDGNLLLDLDFNQTSGNTAWDTSGNNNHGTAFNSPEWVDEKGNTAK